MADEPSQRHGLADFLEEKLPELKAEWEAGRFSSLIEAYVWCAGNGYHSPEWLTEAVLDELTYSMNHRPRGGTKKGNAASRERYERMHRVRCLLVKQCIAFQIMDIEQGRRSNPVSEIEAARSAQASLPGKHFAWGTPEQILKSYKRLKSG